MSKALAFSSFPNLICIRRSLAKSDMLNKSLLCDMKWALYPKVKMRTSLKPGSDGSHSLGQNNERSLLKDQDSRLDPPRPCTNIISAVRSSKGSWTIWRPRGSSRRLRERLRDRGRGSKLSDANVGAGFSDLYQEVHVNPRYLVP